MNVALAPPGVVAQDQQRADLYNYLGVILSGPPSQTLLDQTATLSGSGGDLGVAIDALARIARRSTPSSVEAEFNTLFVGLGRGELLPYGSYYLTGFLNEKPLACLRRDMAALGLERAENIREPEDNIASLMEIMGALVVGRFNEPATLAMQKTFFDSHVGPWAGHFFSDLEAAANAVFFAPVGAVGRIFMDIEAENFRMSA